MWHNLLFVKEGNHSSVVVRKDICKPVNKDIKERNNYDLKGQKYKLCIVSVSAVFMDYSFYKLSLHKWTNEIGNSNKGKKFTPDLNDFSQ